MDQSVNVTEAAARLGVSRRKVWQLIREGTLPYQRDPVDRRQKLIPVDALNDLRSDHSAPPELPSFIGCIADGTFDAAQIDEYLAEHWRPWQY
jgi:excisionase family DNA binding protein